MVLNYLCPILHFCQSGRRLGIDLRNAWTTIAEWSIEERKSSESGMNLVSVLRDAC